MAQIKTTNGYLLEIDDEDLELVARYRWFYSSGKKEVRTLSNTLRLGRFLLQPSRLLVVTHRDANPLNFRRDNLRSLPPKLLSLENGAKHKRRFGGTPKPFQLPKAFNDNDEFERAFSQATLLAE